MPGGLFHVSGNPESDGTWTYTWEKGEKGRQLKQMQSVDTDASFVYNESGLRVQKTVNGVVTNYTLHGKNIVHMTQGDNNLHFFYDASNKPAIVEYNGTKYAYVCNLQGDIVAILDSAGNKVVEYAYDAWGRPIKKEGSLAETLGTVQPFRYRGYVYDEETGLYYLRSRYYAVHWCRFVNADSILGAIRLNAHNSYLYCRNKPIVRLDCSGCEDIPLPRPTRPDDWNKGYLEAERERAVRKALDAFRCTVENSFQFAKAQQIEATGAGLIHTKRGGTLYFQTTDMYNEYYRRSNSSYAAVIDLTLYEVATRGLASFAKKKTENIWMPAILDFVGNIKLVIEFSNGLGNAYIDDFLQQDETIGIVSFVYDGSAHPCFPWNAETILDLYGDIDWVKLGEYSGGEP